VTRLVTTGYETGDVAEIGRSQVGTNGSITLQTASPAARTPGVYCLRVATVGNSAGIPTFKEFDLGTSKTDLWVRFSLWCSLAREAAFAMVADSAGTAQACITWAPDGFLRLRLGNADSGTLLGTSALTVAANTWHTIDWRMQISSTTSGIGEVWLDGSRQINFSGDNTNTANANVRYVWLGYGVTVGSIGGGQYFAFDDIAINDTAGTLNNGQIGEGRVVLLKPTGAGSNTNQTRGGTDTGANWSQTSELPPSLTQYVYAATAGVRDTYALQDLPAGSWAVNAVEVVAYAQNSDASAGSLAPTIKSGPTTSEGTATALAATASYVRHLYETDPATGLGWTTSAANALEAGTTVR
jgi:hypothetical protein